MQSSGHVRPTATSGIQATEAPGGMTLHAIPDSMKVHSAERYRYGMINDHPVVVEHSSHKIVHT
jgi:hypothetical protein